MFSPYGLLLGSDQGSYVCMDSLQNSSRGRKQKKSKTEAELMSAYFFDVPFLVFLYHF